MKQVIALLFALAILGAACGSDDSVDVGSGSQDDQGQTEEPTRPPASDEPEADESDDQPDADLPLGGGPYPVGTLEFNVSHPELGELSYVISCLGDTATLTGDWSPNEVDTIGSIAGDEMCLSLGEAEVHSLLVDGLSEELMCTQIFGGPETATVTGELDGDPVDAEFNRNDGCGIDSWDRVMAVLLPPAAGA